jgi:hypothetical protein
VSDSGAAATSSGPPLRHHPAAVDAGARAHVDDVVGGADRLLVVLDDDDAVADVAQVKERADQALVVALVQADRRLVEDVHHPGQARADLRREPDPLRLAARERLGAAVEAQVVEADVVEELEARADLADHLVGDLGLGAGEREVLEPGQRLAQREVLDPEDRLLVAAGDVDQEHVPRLDAQARAVAVRTRLGALQASELLAHRRRVGLAQAPLEVGKNPLERMAPLDDPVLAARALGLVDELDLDRARSRAAAPRAPRRAGPRTACRCRSRSGRRRFRAARRCSCCAGPSP